MNYSMNIVFKVLMYYILYFKYCFKNIANILKRTEFG